MTPAPGLIVDAHLDLAFNAVNGRDLTLTLPDLRASMSGPDTPLVTFGELRDARVGLALCTLFAAPVTPEDPHGYTDAEGARAQAVAQLDQYRRWEDAGHLRLLRSSAEIWAHVEAWTPGSPLGAVILMEGADPVRTPDEVAWWVREGVRLIGPAWGATRYAGGTAAPGPLTDAGVELLHAMRESGTPLDASHLDEAAFWQAIEIQPAVVATHSNARALLPGDQPNMNRHLTNDMARAIGSRGGVIGLVPLNPFTQAGWTAEQPRLPMSALAAHAEHYASLVGWAHVGLGSDLDGGFGVEKVPAGMERVRDITALFDLLPPEHRDAVRAGNWLRWLTTHL